MIQKNRHRTKLRVPQHDRCKGERSTDDENGSLEHKEDHIFKGMSIEGLVVNDCHNTHENEFDQDDCNNHRDSG
jgi:hypothetical protein